MRKYYKLLSRRLFFIYTCYVILFTVAVCSVYLVYNNLILCKAEQKATEQIVKLMTLGVTEKQAEQKIIEGFLK